MQMQIDNVTEREGRIRQDQRRASMQARQRVSGILLYVLAGMFGFAITMAALAPDTSMTLMKSTLGQFGLFGCSIKGNVSINSGARIYHLPGQRNYAETRISIGKGERYFCSEADARSAGWRRAGI